ncbi:MAG: replication initiator protein A [Caulobacteraceae bacterium]
MKPVTVQQDLFQGPSLGETTSLRNDREIMSYPFFTLGKQPVHTARESRWTEEDGREVYIRNSPGEFGLPTTWDMDILIYVQTLINHSMQRGEPVSPRVQFQVYDCLKAIRRGTGGNHYERFLASLMRLTGSMVFTNISSGDKIRDAGFNWLQTFDIIRDKSGKMIACEIVLCEWLYNSILSGDRLLQVDSEYFDLDSGLYRKVYQMIRRHIGNASSWHIGLEKLYLKSGASSEMKKFVFDVREMVKVDPFPKWTLHLSTDHRGAKNGGSVVAPTSRSREPLYLYVFRRHPALMARSGS